MKRRRKYRKYQQYAVELKRQAVARVLAGETVTAVARELGVPRRRLYGWRAKAEWGGLEALRATGRPPRGEAAAPAVATNRVVVERGAAARRIAELERLVGQQQADLDFFRQALRHVKARQQTSTGRGGLRSTKSSG